MALALAGQVAELALVGRTASVVAAVAAQTDDAAVQSTSPILS